MYLNQIQLNLIKLQWLLPLYRPNTFSSFSRANHFWMLVFLVFAHVSFCALVSFSAFVLADYVLDHCQILEPHQSLAHNNIPLAHNWSSNIIYIYQCHILWCVIHYMHLMFDYMSKIVLIFSYLDFCWLVLSFYQESLGVFLPRKWECWAQKHQNK